MFIYFMINDAKICQVWSTLTSWLNFLRLAKSSFRGFIDQPTHIEGGKLDHLFVRKLDVVDVQLHHPYYSDHDAIIAMFQKWLTYLKGKQNCKGKLKYFGYNYNISFISHCIFLSIPPGARIYVPTQLRQNIYNWSFQILEINLGELSIMEVNCSQSLASQGIQCRR